MAIDLNKTYCASPQCKNECGNQFIIPKEDELNLDVINSTWGVAMNWDYFCGKPSVKFKVIECQCGCLD